MGLQQQTNESWDRLGECAGLVCRIMEKVAKSTVHLACSTSKCFERMRSLCNDVHKPSCKASEQMR